MVSEGDKKYRKARCAPGVYRRCRRNGKPDSVAYGRRHRRLRGLYLALALVFMAYTPKTRSAAEVIMGVSLYYWNDMPNFGDRLNEDLCRFLESNIFEASQNDVARIQDSLVQSFPYNQKMV